MKLTTITGYALGVGAIVVLAVTAPIKILVEALHGRLIRRPQIG